MFTNFPTRAGFTNVEPYPYEVDENHELKLDLVLEKIRQVKEPEKAVLILHTSAHNPTGVDPTKEQWVELKKICHERGILPVFDCAYQVQYFEGASRYIYVCK